jgi:hypothetical protein
LLKLTYAEAVGRKPACDPTSGSLCRSNLRKQRFRDATHGLAWRTWSLVVSKLWMMMGAETPGKSHGVREGAYDEGQLGSAIAHPIICSLLYSVAGRSPHTSSQP